MRNGLMMLASLALLAGCNIEIPGFLGREGDASEPFRFGRAAEEPLPDPVPVPLRTAELERALHGVILRVEGVAPTQGFYSAALLPVSAVPDAAGILGFDFVARPPEVAEAVGPERTRLLTAAVFLPNLALKDLRGLRVAGSTGARTLPLR